MLTLPISCYTCCYVVESIEINIRVVGFVKKKVSKVHRGPHFSLTAVTLSPSLLVYLTSSIQVINIGSGNLTRYSTKTIKPIRIVLSRWLL